MTHFIDIHTHILPFVDDGSKSMPMSEDMLSIAMDEGIETIVATPHFIPGMSNCKLEDRVSAFIKVREYVERNNLPINVVLGNEIYLDDQTVEKLKNRECLPIGNTQYALLELPMAEAPRKLEYMISCVLEAGFYPIIAHPERYHWLMEEEEALDSLIHQGCLMQVNTGSITGFYGKAVFHAVKNMFQNNKVHLVGTDAHSNRNRSPKMKEAYELIRQWAGQNYADQLFYKSAKGVLYNTSPALIIEEVSRCHANSKKEPKLFQFHGQEKNTSIPGFFMKLLIRKP